MSYQIKVEMPLTEASVDQALISVSELMSTLVQASVNTGVPAVTGQVAVCRLAKVQLALVEASSDVLRAHGELTKTGEEYAGRDVHGTCPPALAIFAKGKLSSVAA